MKKIKNKEDEKFIQDVFDDIDKDDMSNETLKLMIEFVYEKGITEGKRLVCKNVVDYITK